jgi:hypothetical protein
MKPTLKLAGLILLLPVFIALAIVMHLGALKLKIAALEWLGWL